VTLGGVVAAATLAQAQPGAAPAAQPQRSKIAIVNIAKVLKEYKKANHQGKEISTKRQEYLDRVNAFRNAMNEKTKSLNTPQGQQQKAAIEKEVLELQRRIEDVDREAQKTLTQMSNDTIVRVYNEIKGVIEAIAVANAFELVMAYPDASSTTEENTPVVAQLKLQTPALMPFYHRNVDITDFVVRTLNERYPAPATPVSAAPSGTNNNPITPVGGKN
jgi:Skp family chaperone for outer membrane proteins